MPVSKEIQGTDWHTLSSEDVCQRLQTSLSGLSNADSEKRLAELGPNELIEKGGRTAARILWEQLTATMVLILIAAAIMAAFLGDSKNAIAITAIVLLYAILGLIQEYRAEKAIAALRRMSVPNVRVVRDGKLIEISSRELVPGDIIQLEAGNVVPADARMIEAFNLRVQEAALTGESEPVSKQIAVLAAESLPLGDRTNMTYMGTVVAHGRGLAVIVATGMKTEIGKIADLLQKTGTEETPLQKRLDKLGRQLAIAGIAIAAFILALGLWHGEDLRFMVLTAVSVAVAIVPEGLPAVVTITLALGAQRMLKRNALIRKLPAVETLGSVTVICSDKTGTLTENRMTVVVMDVAEHALDLTESVDKSGITRTFRNLGQPAQSSLSLLTLGGALCNDAKLIDEGGDQFRTLGDPTEGALVAVAAQMGYWKSSIDETFPRVAELAFDSDRKRMTTIHHLKSYQPETLAGLDAGGKPYIAFTKGSVDGLLSISTHVRVNGQVEPMTEEWRERIEATNAKQAGKGMRVLGLAYRLIDTAEAGLTDLEQGLTFVGMFGMIDPPRQEVKDAIALTKTAGVRTVMITGDHPLTALEIARQLGISDNGLVLTGTEIERLSFEELKAKAAEVCVFARVAPEHKLKIVEALQANGQIVSMTGDGVNDAPALRRADIGVAMGITGTDVTKEASDLVLLDDNFSTIVAAVQEGRTIYDNIRKFVRFSVAGNIGKVMVVLLAPFSGMPMPLMPLQMLWLNLLTDGLLGLGMGVEPAEKGTMRRPPYSPQEGVFSHGAGLHTMWVGMLIGSLGLGVGAWYYFNGRPEWQTMVFTSLAFSQIGQALAARSGHDSLFSIGLGSNMLMIWMVLAVFALQLPVIYVPSWQTFFYTQALGLMDMAIAAGTGIVVFAVIEIMKKITGQPVSQP